jgi:hypothetical protein
VRQYGADQVQISWFGIPISEGLAAGTFIQITRNAPTWTQKPNGLGGVVRMFNPDLSGQVTLSMDKESKTHQSLVTVATADYLSRSIIGPMVITDASTREVTVLNSAYISTVPNLQWGTQSTVLGWVFNFQAVLNQSFGFDRNVVGS